MLGRPLLVDCDRLFRLRSFPYFHPQPIVEWIDVVRIGWFIRLQ